MNANELIESYVADVAGRLPYKQRNDVAFELRALLTEELQAKADAAGREANEPMALELLKAFGRPADVAGRYLPTLSIIDPADGRNFLRLSIIGVLLLWALGVLEALMSVRETIDSRSDVLRIIVGGLVDVVLPSLWWPGLMVVCFGIAAWMRRVWPQSGEWSPSSVDRDRDRASQTGLVLGIAGIACVLFVLLNPQWPLDFLFRGRASPELHEAFTYTQSFRERQWQWLVLLIAADIPLLIFVTVRGRWSIVTRQIDIALILSTCAVMAWALFSGPVMVGLRADRFFKFCLAISIAFALIDVAIKAYRGIRPEPMPNDRIPT